MESLLYLPEPFVTAERNVPARGTSDFDYLAEASRTLNASLDYGEIVKGLLKIIRTAMRAEAVLLAVRTRRAGVFNIYPKIAKL